MKELLRDGRVRRLLVANTLGSIGSGITIFSVPWLLVHREGGWYMVGFDRDRQASRVFRTSRIVGDLSTADAATGPVDPGWAGLLDDYFARRSEEHTSELQSH